MAVRELVENSFPYDEPILIRNAGRVELLKIGDLVERKLAEQESFVLSVDERYYSHIPEGIEVLTLDEGLKLSFKRVTAVFKHRAPRTMWRIKLQSGREVTTTSAHNVFVLEEDLSVVSKETSKLGKGERVVVPASGAVTGGILEIDTIAELMRLDEEVTERIVVHGLAQLYHTRMASSQTLLQSIPGETTTYAALHEVAAGLGLQKPDNLIYSLLRNRSLSTESRGRYRVNSREPKRKYLSINRDWVRCDSVPFNFIRSNPPPVSPARSEDLELSVKQGRGRFPATLPVTRELMRILGYYSSEGSICSNRKVSFSFGAHEMGTHVKDLVECLRNVFHVEPTITREHETAVNVVVNDASLAFLFEKVLGTGKRSEDKRVPWIVFNVRKEYAEDYLTAYVRGDGHVQIAKRNRKITLATSSLELFTGLKFLLTLLGRHYSCSFSKEEERTIKGVKARFDGSFYIYIRQGIAPEETSIPISRFRRELINESKCTNLYRRNVQKGWLRRHFSPQELPQNLRQFVLSDAGSLPVREIKAVEPSSEWVYDIAVAEVERFIGGGAVALLHNSLDACELARMAPDVYVRVVADGTGGESSEPRAYRVTVADNGPGVEPQHVPRAFGKVFYGSKYVLRQSRGMFGMGGTMAVLYGQITTNKPVKVTTSTDGKSRHIFEMLIDIGENKPVILRRDTEEANGKTGTRVDIMLEGDFTRSAQKINEYFKQTALVCSYANLTFVDPIGRISTFERATEELPPAPQETLPHPYGVDVEAFKRMVKLNEEKTLKRFMTTHFHRVGDRTAQKFLEFAGIKPEIAPEKLSNEQVVTIVDALQRFQEFLPPDSSCLSPVGEQILGTGIVKELEPEFSTVVVRPPSSYSGFPFLVEVGLVYGGKALEPGRKLFRFANRIPLLYDESSDVSFRVLDEEIDWRRYHVPDEAPVAVITHICLPSFERVLANVDGALQYTTIGEMVDTEMALSKGIEVKDGVTYVIPKRSISVPSVDPQTFRVAYVPVKKLMRREGGPILRITTEEGRVVHVSPEHPVLVMAPNGIESKAAVEIVSGDYLVGARRIPVPHNDFTTVDSLDLIDCFVNADLEDEITVVGAKGLLYDEAKAKMAGRLNVSIHSIGNWRKHDRMPLSAYLKLEEDKSFRSSVKLLGRRSHGVPIPAIVSIGPELARLLGFYLAEGCSGCASNNVVSFSFHRAETAFQSQVVESLSRIFGVSPSIANKKRDRAVQITAYNKALALLFSRALKAGTDSYSKRVPSFVFSTSRGFIELLLDSYFAGDGYFYHPTRHVNATTSSEELIQGIFTLARMVGLEVSVNRFANHFRLEVLGGENYFEARRILPTVMAKKSSRAELEAFEYRPSTARRIPVFAFAERGALPSLVKQHIGGRASDDSRISDVVARRLGVVNQKSERLITGDIQCLRVRKVEVLDYDGMYYNIETDRDIVPNYMHGFGIFSHNCSTKVPYKTVGKEYIADRPEIEAELRNAVREALRRLSLYLSKKGSKEAVQRRMNIYGKYLPLIAKFSQELAGEKKPPKYKQLIQELSSEGEETEEPVQAEVTVDVRGKEHEQAKIEDYS